MILRGTTPRALSAAGFMAVLGLGALLLPLWPTWAQTEPRPQAPRDQEPRLAIPQQSINPAPDPGTNSRLPSYSPRSMVRVPAQGPVSFLQPAVGAGVHAAVKPEDRLRLAEEEKSLAAQIEAARDEVELLQVQLRVKEAQYEATRTGLEHARQRLREVEHLSSDVRSPRALLDAQQEVETQTVQMRVKQAELGEPRVRLQQAHRRLARLQQQREALHVLLGEDRVPSVKPQESRTEPRTPGSVPRETGGARQPGENPRLLDLEKKLDTLLREVEQLRRELRPRRPRDSQEIDRRTGAIRLNSRHLKIPFSINPKARPRVKEVVLFSSMDQGLIWQEVATVAPNKGFFEYHAPADGLYWFIVCTVDHEGKHELTEPGKPDLIVVVDTRS